MRVALTVAPGRYSAPAEVARLLGMVAPAISYAGAEFEEWQPTPLPWLEWVAERAPGLEWSDTWGRFVGSLLPQSDFDLLVGFEIPDNVKAGVQRWVDIRRHPVRFRGDFWSITDSRGPFEVEDAVQIPEQSRLAEYTSMGAFACQVSFDSALIRNGRIIRPADVMEGIRCFAHRFEVLFVGPHPLEPRGPWVDAVLEIPNAALSPWRMYELLGRVRDVCTVSSSVGTEARYFGVETTWLAGPMEHSAPIADLGSVDLWGRILERFRPAVSRAA